MSRRITRRGVNAGIGAALLSPALATRFRFRPRRRTDQNRLRHGAHRPACRERAAGAARQPDLGRRNQCKGRPARPAGPTHPLRRSIESVDGARHLYEAARRRQMRSRAERLCDQHDRARHSRRHAEEQGFHQPVRARCQFRVPLSEILLIHPDGGPQPETDDQRRLLPGRGRTKPEAANRRDRGRGCRVLAQCGRGRARQRQTIWLQSHL